MITLAQEMTINFPETLMYVAVFLGIKRKLIQNVVLSKNYGFATNVRVLECWKKCERLVDFTLLQYRVITPPW